MALPEFPPGPQDAEAWRQLLVDRGLWFLAPALDDAEIESALRLLAHGLAIGRPGLLRIAGNGVVPQQAAVAYRELLRGIEEMIS